LREVEAVENRVTTNARGGGKDEEEDEEDY
jgi:hypothetical protein